MDTTGIEPAKNRLQGGRFPTQPRAQCLRGQFMLRHGNQSVSILEHVRRVELRYDALQASASPTMARRAKNGAEDRTRTDVIAQAARHLSH